MTLVKGFGIWLPHQTWAQESEIRDMLAAPHYPPDWEVIAWNVKAEAGWVCEHCSRAHDAGNGYCLTVHHLDMDKANCDYTNLVALCQRCHLSIQARYRVGQRWLFAPPQWAIRRGLA